ncbi:Uncharacterized protein SCF082_LOCUS18750, partial [Durusdinium trenchii]
SLWSRIVLESKKCVDATTLVEKGVHAEKIMNEFFKSMVVCVPKEANQGEAECDIGDIFPGHNSPDHLRESLKSLLACGNVATLCSDLGQLSKEEGVNTTETGDVVNPASLTVRIRKVQALITAHLNKRSRDLQSQLAAWLDKLWPAGYSLKSYAPDTLDGGVCWRLELMSALGSIQHSAFMLHYNAVRGPDPIFAWCLLCSSHIWNDAPKIHEEVSKDPQLSAFQSVFNLSLSIWSKLESEKKPGEAPVEGLAAEIVPKIEEVQARLLKLLNDEGKKFLADGLAAAVCPNADAGTSEAFRASMGQMFAAATPELQSCHRTVSTAFQIAQDQVDVPREGDFTAMLEIMPRHAKVVSLNPELAQMLPTQVQDVCSNIQEQVRGRLAELIDEMNVELQQFRSLDSADVNADVSLLLELRTNLHEKSKGLTKMVSFCDGDESLKALCGNMKLLLDNVQVARRDVLTTISVMMGCDVFLNKKHAKDLPGTLAKVLHHLGTLGVTKADIGKMSPKLLSQMNELDGSLEKERGKKRPSASPRAKEVETAPAPAPPKKPKGEKKEKKEKSGKRQKKDKED